jgi:hypothetical protein
MILRPEGLQQTSSSTVTVNNGIGKIVVGTGTLLGAFTMTFPSAPNDRDNLIIFFNGGVTLLTFLSNLSFANTLPTTAALGLVMCYEYEQVSNKWYRLY